MKIYTVTRFLPIPNPAPIREYLPTVGARRSSNSIALAADTPIDNASCRPRRAGIMNAATATAIPSTSTGKIDKTIARKGDIFIVPDIIQERNDSVLFKK